MAVAGLLTACGGGGGDSSPAQLTITASAEGQYIGTTNANQAVTATILDNGKYYAQYSAAGNPGIIAGVVTGTVTSNNGALGGGVGTDYNLEGAGVVPVTLSGTYAPKQSITGTLTYSNGVKVTLPGSYDATYDTMPTQAAVTGTFAGSSATALGSDAVTLSADANGNITGNGTNCPFTGSIKPHSHGNVYDIGLTFSSGVGCAYPGQTASGIGLLNSTGKVIHGLLQTPSNQGILFIGAKPQYEALARHCGTNCG
jgi:hypothetical protein